MNWAWGGSWIGGMGSALKPMLSYMLLISGPSSERHCWLHNVKPSVLSLIFRNVCARPISLWQGCKAREPIGMKLDTCKGTKGGNPLFFGIFQRSRMLRLEGQQERNGSKSAWEDFPVHWWTPVPEGLWVRKQLTWRKMTTTPHTFWLLLPKEISMHGLSWGTVAMMKRHDWSNLRREGIDRIDHSLSSSQSIITEMWADAETMEECLLSCFSWLDQRLSFPFFIFIFLKILWLVYQCPRLNKSVPVYKTSAPSHWAYLCIFNW